MTEKNRAKLIQLSTKSLPLLLTTDELISILCESINKVKKKNDR